MSYQAKVRIKGHPPQSATFDRKSEAVKWTEDVECALLNGLPLPGEVIPRDDKSFKESVEDYLFLMEQSKNRSKHTIKTDGETAKRLIARFGRLTLRTLRREDIEEHKEDRLREVGPATVRHDLSMLSRIYETARIKWRMESLPFPGESVKLPPPPSHRTRIIADHQFGALLEECKRSKNPKLYPLVLLLLGTGMRPAEAITLRWRQVLFETGVVLLPKTKTVPRRVPVPEDCLDLLLSMRGDAEVDALIFTSESNLLRDKPVRTYRRAFEQACIRCQGPK